MAQECAPKAFCRMLHSGFQEQRSLFDTSCGKWQSIASICQLFSRQTTTFHPAPRHHHPEREAASLLYLDLPRLFFEPGSKCLPTDTEHAGNASHARSFMICTDYFFLFFFAPARANIFAPILLPTLSIMSVFYAVTVAASVGDDFLLY